MVYPFSADELWSRSIEDVAKNVVMTTYEGDERFVTTRSAILSARVLLDIAQRQEETTRTLVAATQHLVWVTLGVAGATVVVAIVAAAVG